MMNENGDTKNAQRKRNRSRRGGGGRKPGGGAKDASGGTVELARAESSVTTSSSVAAPPKKRRNQRKKQTNENGNTDTVKPGVVAPPPKTAQRKNTTGATTTNAAKNDESTPKRETTDMEIDSPSVDTTLKLAAITDPSFMTPHLFANQPPELIHPLTLKAITERMKLERLTEVQYKTLAESKSMNKEMSFNDILGRARTGTGKTLAFLIPALETVLSSSPNNSNNKGIPILVISPTRELATQIMTQAQQVLFFHKDLSVQLIIGGTNIKSDISQFNRQLPTVLVATPGRMKDHLQNTTLKNGSSFASAVANLLVLVLDEADQLLEMGFRADILKIVSYLPKERQTLLFSATMPSDLRQVMAQAMKSNYKTVDCIHDFGEKQQKETNAQVEQTHVVMEPGMGRLVIGVIETMLAAMSGAKDYKIIAFFPTARIVGYFAELVNLGIRKQFPSSPFPSIVEIHSRKSQANRNKASDKFRSMKSGILFTSDVSARGVDYPNVTHVIQFGLPDSREQYIHRLGRTGRAGRAGRGWLVLADFERPFLKELQKGQGGGVDVPLDPELDEVFSNPPSKEAQDLLYPVLRDHVGSGKNKELVRSAQQAYQSWLGFYKDRTKRMAGNMSKAEMVQMANEFAKLCGLREQPTLLKKTVGKMGLKGVPGLNVANTLP